MNSFPVTAPTLLTLTALAAALPAQGLLKDFNQTPSTAIASSFPTDMHPGPNGGLLFTAWTPATGRELWFSDGSAPGTTLLADIFPGPNDSDLTGFTPIGNNVYLFVATTPGQGTELWRTDGTPGGTALVKDVRPGEGSSRPRELTRLGNEAAFFADDGVHGLELWRTDGTTAGTQLVADLEPGAPGLVLGARSMAALGNGTCVFGAYANGQWRIWGSDLTLTGTSAITTLPQSFFTRPTQFTRLGSRVLFESEDGLLTVRKWVTDGTASGTLMLPARGPGEFQIAGTLAYFRGIDDATGIELWKTDGTAAGTSMVIDLDPVTGFFNGGRPVFVGTLQNNVYFYGSDPTGRHLFRSDGTAAGTVPISDVVSIGFQPTAPIGIASNGFLYYQVAGFGSSLLLHRTDGTAAGSHLVTSKRVNGFGSIGQALLFGGGDDQSQVGNELWVTDGAQQNEQLLVDIVPPPLTESSFPNIIGSFRDRAALLVDDGVHGNELWLTDGTQTGTSLLIDLEPGTASPSFRGFAANEQHMLILANTLGNDSDPWFSDGTAAGTYQLDVHPPGASFQGESARPFGANRFVFSGRLNGSGLEPWITDGTVAGTFQLREIYQGSQSSYPRGWLELDDLMLFSASDAAGRAVWRTDGTAAGTFELVRPVNPQGYGSSVAFQPTRFGPHVYFMGGTLTEGLELWRSDGTVAGTSLAIDIDPGFGSTEPRNLVALDHGIVMKATIGLVDHVVFTDGSSPVAFEVIPIGAEFEGPYPLDGGHALLIVEDPIVGNDQLWRTDGTATGTVFVRSIQRGSTPIQLGIDRTLLALDDGLLGTELWSTDGTVSGTELVVDLAPTSSDPRGMTRAGAHIVFAADDGLHGVELFSVPFALSNDWVVATYGSGCPGTNGVTPTIDYTGTARTSATQPFVLQLRDALPTTLALLAWSTERGATEIPGCTIGLAGQIATLATMTNANGDAALPVVPTPGLLGFRFDAQWFGLDPAGAALGFLSATPAIEFVFGP